MPSIADNVAMANFHRRGSLNTPSAPRCSGCSCVGSGAPGCCWIVTPWGQFAGAIAM
jgi:hypothetical protein